MEDKTKIIIGALFLIIGAVLFIYFSKTYYPESFGINARINAAFSFVRIFILLLMVSPLILVISTKFDFMTKHIKILLLAYVILVTLVGVLKMPPFGYNAIYLNPILLYGIVSAISAYLT